MRQGASDQKLRIKLLDDATGIAYVEQGAGETLVFVHGSLCDYRFWQPQLDGLRDRFHVVAPSLSHFHPKLPSSARLRFSWSAHVDQLGAFLAKLGKPRIHLIGHSRGGCIAYHATARQPQLIASLTLIDPGGGAHDSGSGQDEFRQRAVELVGAGRTSDGLKLFVDSVSRAGTWDKSPLHFRTMALDNAPTLALQFNDPLPAYTSAVASGIVCPTLLVCGAYSPLLYKRNVETLAGWMPSASAVTINGASHGLTTTHSGEFNRRLVSFIGIVVEQAASNGGK